MMMKSPSTMHLLPTGGFSRWRCSSIQCSRFSGGSRAMCICSGKASSHDSAAIPTKKAARAFPGSCCERLKVLPLRHQDLVDHEDLAVGLGHVGNRDVGDIALVIGHRPLAVVLRHGDRIA